MKRLIIASLPFLIISSPLRLSAAAAPAIGQIQASGATADDEFVAIENRGDAAADIGSWSIQYRSANGSTFYKKNFAKGASVAAGGTYVACGKDYAGACDMRHSSFSLSAAGGTVFLVSNQALLSSESGDSVADKKTYSAEAPEEAPTPQSPEARPATAAQPPSAQTLKMNINELMPQPKDGGEWIEIFNPTGYAVDLAGWTLADGTGRAFAAPEGLIMPNSFRTIELASARLNDGGDLAILRDAAKKEIDAVAYGDWDGGAGNAPAPGPGAALARIGDGRDTDDDKSDFAPTSSPTPGAANRITPPQDEKSQITTTKLQNPSGAKTVDAKTDVDKLIEALNGKSKIIVIENLYIGNEPGAKIAAASVEPRAAAAKSTTAAKAAAKAPAAAVAGQVIVPPGVIGKDICVVREAESSAEVRLPKGLKEAPRAGDIVHASGSWSEAKTLTMPRLLVKTAAAFSAIGHADPPAAAPIPLSAAGERVGELVEIEAPIAEKQPTRFRLAEGEISVLIKEPLEASVGDRVAASGLLAKSGESFLLTPLSPADIRVIKPPAPPAPSLARRALPYGLAAVPAGLLTAAAYAGQRLRRAKGGDSR